MTTTGDGTTGTAGTVPDGVGDGITGTVPVGDGTLAGDGTVGTVPVGVGDGTTGMVRDGDTVGMEMVGTDTITPTQEEGEPEVIMETDTQMDDITDEHPILLADGHRQEIILVREPETHQQEAHRFLPEIHLIQEITITTT